MKDKDHTQFMYLDVSALYVRLHLQLARSSSSWLCNCCCCCRWWGMVLSVSLRVCVNMFFTYLLPWCW